MNEQSLDKIAENPQFINLYFGISKDWWEAAYYIGQGVAVTALLIGIILTVYNLRLSRRTLSHIENTNRENNLIQERYVLQSRLIELSHEWNSQNFINARNKASYLFEVEFRDKAYDIRKALFNKQRLDDWIHISMVAHFFRRLSYIQSSGQIDLKNASLEFAEAIDYWLDFLVDAYSDNPKEKHIRDQLKLLHTIYYPKPEGDGEVIETH